MQVFSVTESTEVAHARRGMCALAQSIGLNDEDAGRAALVATEICSNLVKHGGGGQLLMRSLDDAGRRGIELLGLDKGPGMDDIDKCLADGYSTGGSPGTGLGAIRRQSQVFDLHSQPGKGTAVLAQIWPQARAPRSDSTQIGAIVVPKPGETECGDAWCSAERSGGVLISCVDGLGHGLGAAQAASRACELLDTERHGSPAAILQKLHNGLRHTRGAAVSLLDIDWNERRLTSAGVGNIVAAIVTHAGARRIPSDNGIVGHTMPRVRELNYALEPDALIVVHSDGLSSGWQPEQYPGLTTRHPSLVSGVLYRDYKRGRDDCVVVTLKRAAP